MNLNITALFALSILYSQAIYADDEVPIDRGETLIITSDFRDQQQQLFPGSITILDDNRIKDSAQQHFQELINWVPNLNFAGGSSRPRYFQIRGIGERSQYQGAPNPSVGFIVDDIDFSGIGGIATLFDIEQIEVLKGPQGTRFGANALAGLITINSVDPSAERNALFQLSYGQDNTQSLGVATNAELNSQLFARVSIQKFQSDGFRENIFLNRTDTNQRDETSARLKLVWQSEQSLTAKLTLLNINLDNGYDAFAHDNSFTTLTDLPGRDEQDTSAVSLRIDWDGNQKFNLQSITSYADSDILFSFDGDWGNPMLWGVNGPYDFTSTTNRQRQSLSQEFRFVSKTGAEILASKADWLVGVYLQQFEEGNQILDLYNGAIFNNLESQYDANSMAIFSQINYHLSTYTTLSFGLRIEDRDASYNDSNGQNVDPNETMFGGHISLEHIHHNGNFSYLKLARGYKAGGFNIGTNIPAAQVEFDSEFVWNFELGYNASWFEQRLKTQLSVFYMQRDEQQVETSFQLDPNDPLTFIFVTDNAASGYNYGLEFQSRFDINHELQFFTNLGLLQTEFDDAKIGTRDLQGREQAHAPKYNYAMGINYQNDFGIFSVVEVTGKDEFFFSNSHDKKSKSYNLINVQLGYQQNNWSIAFWGRNILDKNYAVRGFFFANEPPDFIDTLYTRQGDPMNWGVTAKIGF